MSPDSRRRSSDVIRSRQRRSGDQGRTARSDAQPVAPMPTAGALDSAAVRARAMTARRHGHGDWARLPGLRSATPSAIRSACPRARTWKERWTISGCLLLTREQAQAIVTPFMTKLEAEATEKLVSDLHFVLTVSQLTALRTQIDRQLSGRPGPGAPNHVVRSADGKTFQVFMGGPDLTQRINGVRSAARADQAGTGRVRELQGRESVPVTPNGPSCWHS